MKKKQIEGDLNKAVNNLNLLILACRGDKSDCSVNNLKEAEIYAYTWIKPYLSEIEELLK